MNKADVVQRIPFSKRKLEPPKISSVNEAGRKVARITLSEAGKVFRHPSGVIQTGQGEADPGPGQQMLSPSTAIGSGTSKDCNGNSDGVSGPADGNESPTSLIPRLDPDGCRDEEALPVG